MWWMHRLGGAALIVLGTAILGGEIVLLYGPSDDYGIAVRIGIPGVGLLALLGLFSFAGGVGLATAPALVVHHTKGAVSAARRLSRSAAATRQRGQGDPQG